MICPQGPKNETNCNILSSERPFFLLQFNFETHFQKIYKKAAGRVNLLRRICSSIDSSAQQIKFTSRWFCQYLRIAAIIVLDGQSPAKAWSAPLRNETSKSFPRNAVTRTSIFNNRQRFAKESALFCIWLPPKNGTACFPFRNYFQPFDHNAQTLETMGKQQNCPRWNYFIAASIHCH